MPNSVLTRGRSWIARFAVLALVASMMVIGAVPAGAAIDTSSSCPDSIPSAGFTDLAGLNQETVDAIDCIAFYGISQGTSATTFSPMASVPRWQMALFLIRQAEDHGVTIPAASDQGFTDISGLSQEAQDAINQLAQLGITQGTSATTFSPNNLVARWQMALFLTRLLDEAGVTLPADPADAGFTDISSLSAEAQLAIEQLAELDITDGTSATTYSPFAAVARWQMALFLTRVLAADGIVPFGVSVQADSTAAFTNETVQLTITFRDSEGNLVEGQRVDVFVADSFNADGTANVDGDATLDIAGDAGTGTDATIDAGDPQTNSDGEIIIDLTHAGVAETDTVIAWVGNSGDTFDQDDVDASDMASIEITWSLGAVAVTGPADFSAHFGTQETISAQLEDTNNDPVAKAGEDIKFTVTRGGSVIVVQTVQTNASGAASFSYTGPADPSNGDDSIADVVTVLWDQDGDGVADGGEPTDTVNVTWDDDDPVATTLTVEQSSVSSLVSTSLTVTATVTDQYGDPVAGADVEFDPASIGSGVRTTNSSGVATFTYTGPAGNTDDDVAVDVDVNDDGSFTGELTSTVTHFWVDASGDDANISGTIVGIGGNFVDLDTSAGATPSGDGFVRVFWDSNDQFNVLGSADSMADFVASLDVGDQIDVDYDDTESEVSSWDNVTG